jgi:proteasome beta subunit
MWGEDQYTDGMTEKGALQVAAKALLASAQRDAASGNGMDLCVITNEEGLKHKVFECRGKNEMPIIRSD